jgi:ABC-type multidrug transport system ATPase subunit
MHKLEIDSVLLNYGAHVVLTDVYLKCETGRITGLLGRNGTGKSSLLEVIYGSRMAKQKFVRFDSIPVKTPFQVPDLMCMLPQFNFIPLGFNIKRVLKDFKLDFAPLIKQLPELERHYRSSIKTLSGGEKRLLELYIVLYSNSKFALLDEPFSQLSPVLVERVKEMILGQKTEKGILITDHMYRDIIEISDDLYLSSGGKIHLVKDLSQLETLGYINSISHLSGDA